MIIKWIKLNMLLFSLLLTGCAMFTSYPSKMKDVRVDVAENDPKAAQMEYIDEFSDKLDEGELNNLELGRLAQYNNEPKKSQEIYAHVINSLAEQMLQAVIQVKKIFENAEAVALNDKVLPYLVPDYEQTFVYTYQAINYLNQDDLTNALVSIRQLSQAQAWITQQKEINKESTEGLNNRYQNSGNQGSEYSKADEYQQMIKASDTITNSYENGFGYYLSSILYQAFDNDFNDAFVSIKDTKRLLPDNPYVIDTFKQIEKGFNGYPPYEEGQGRLVVIYQGGLIEPKRAFNLPIFLGPLGIQNISLPYYASKGAEPMPIRVIVKQNEKLIDDKPTALLVNTKLMAMKSLTEQYPAIVAREVFRIIFKASATYALSRQEGNAGTVGWIIGTVYSVATSGADLRSWLLLPQGVQLYEKAYTAGDYHLLVAGRDQAIKIEQGKTTLILIDHIGQFFQAKVHLL